MNLIIIFSCEWLGIGKLHLNKLCNFGEVEERLMHFQSDINLDKNVMINMIAVIPNKVQTSLFVPIQFTFRVLGHFSFLLLVNWSRKMEVTFKILAAIHE